MTMKGDPQLSTGTSTFAVLKKDGGFWVVALGDWEHPLVPGCGAVLSPADRSIVWGDIDSRQSEQAITGCVSPDSSTCQME